jgi:hypothetical protein
MTAKAMWRSATISDCGRYRYALGRRWDDGPTACWVMLNPSTADADVDDPTIRRCVSTRLRLHAASVSALLSREASWPVLCLGRTKSGQPRHPLYVRGDQAMEVWR